MSQQWGLMRSSFARTISSYSPRLDAHGNSCRGTEVCVELASRLGLHVFDCLNVGSSFLDAIL
jgi:glutaminase